MFKSGFFFIEGVFYNDKRDPLSKDYSKLVHLVELVMYSNEYMIITTRIKTSYSCGLKSLHN